MTTYRTGSESAATIHARPSPTFVGAQVRAVNAILARVYGERVVLDAELVRAWAAADIRLAPGCRAGHAAAARVPVLTELVAVSTMLRTDTLALLLLQRLLTLGPCSESEAVAALDTRAPGRGDEIIATAMQRGMVCRIQRADEPASLEAAGYSSRWSGS